MYVQPPLASVEPLVLCCADCDAVGVKEKVQCQANHHPRFRYTQDEKIAHEWVAGVDRAWYS
eukprot:8003734-Pyramimonas_sp.AAC.1